MFVTKASGEREEFQQEKIKGTCLRAGAPEWLAERVAREVEKKAYDGIPTKEILKITLGLLQKQMPYVAARYDLKGAIMRLGPAGFDFEQLIAELLKEYGYTTKVHNIISGFCIEHEIDVIAEKPENDNKKRFMIECKFHNSPGVYAGIKEILYTQARFEDLQEGIKAGKCQKFDQAWLVTNTKFSSEVVKYAGCRNIKLMGWNFPKQSLQEMLERKRLYPITVLRNLDKYSQRRLASAGFMFCKDILQNTAELKRLIPKKRLELLTKEAEALCK